MKVDISMLDCQVAFLENAIARYVATGVVPGPLGSRHPSIAPFAVFATKDGHIVIAAGTDGLFKRVAEVLGRPALAQDPRFRSNHDRVENALALQAELETALAARGSEEWLAMLEDAGVPHAPLNNVAQVMADPQVKARNMIVTAEDPELGPIRMQGNPIKLSAYEDPATRGPAPDLDGDREAILAWLRTNS
jgi:CoA:oxalate CoA-transferase